MEVAVIADDVASGHPLAEAFRQLRRRGLAGHQLEVIRTNEALTERHYDLVHVCTLGPGAVGTVATARAIGLPVVAGFDSDALTLLGREAVGSIYAQCRLVLSPSRVANLSLHRLGVPPERIARWSLGVDADRFSPARTDPHLLPDAFNVLYAGAVTREHGVDLLAEAFLVARDRHPRLQLVLAGARTGPEQHLLRSRLRSAATFLGELDAERLAPVYASADLFVSPNTTDVFGQAILEAQACGLPVLAVDAGAPAELIETGRSGCLVAPEAGALAGAIRGLARRGALRDRLAAGGLLAIRDHTWERSLAEVAAAYAAALEPPTEVARAA
jgi:glycosyltransferase involved in cell wall biosynthesis